MITKIRSAGIPIYFDPASVGGMMEVNLAEVKSWIAMMDVILLNEEEAMYLTGESSTEKALELLLIECPVVVIKCGAAGAIGCARIITNLGSRPAYNRCRYNRGRRFICCWFYRSLRKK
jgi:sugar/nucleoside kinase (ribokinase family)